jgi:hypothetical protein
MNFHLPTADSATTSLGAVRVLIDAQTIPYADLCNSDLIVDAIYEGDAGSQLSGEPFTNLLPGVGNLGGFRSAGRGQDKKFVVLYSNGQDEYPPDILDLNTGQFIYYGDNKTLGHELHDTPAGGNLILRRVFELLQLGDAEARAKIPPFLVFRKYSVAISARSIRFEGLAGLGFRGLPATCVGAGRAIKRIRPIGKVYIGGIA